MASKIKWRKVKEIRSGNGVYFDYDHIGLVAYIDGYPEIGQSGVVVQLLAIPPEDWSPTLDWEDALTETRSAVTAYLSESCRAHFVKGRIKVSLGA